MTYVEVVIRSLHKSYPGINRNLASIDAESVAYLAICKAAKTYKPEKAQVSAYFSAAIRNALLKELAKSQRWKCDRREDVVHALAARQEHRQSQEANRLKLALAMLPDKERQLIASRYYEGKSVSDIAYQTLQNPKTIRLQMKRALALLSELLGSPIEQPSPPTAPCSDSTDDRSAVVSCGEKPRSNRSSCSRHEGPRSGMPDRARPDRGRTSLRHQIQPSSIR